MTRCTANLAEHHRPRTPATRGVAIIFVGTTAPAGMNRDSRPIDCNIAVPVHYDRDCQPREHPRPIIRKYLR